MTPAARGLKIAVIPLHRIPLRAGITLERLAGTEKGGSLPEWLGAKKT